MNPRVLYVHPNPDFTITLTFTNGEVRVFDVKPYLDKGIFRDLRDPAIFNSVRPFLGSVQWNAGQDFCPDTLYLDSVASEVSAGSLKAAAERKILHWTHGAKPDQGQTRSG